MALVLNATMFIVGIVAGLLGQSSSLIADALDMLADASAYAIALGAIGRSVLALKEAKIHVRDVMNVLQRLRWTALPAGWAVA